MTLAGLLSGTSQGYTLIQGYIISHDRGLSDDDAASMVDKKSLADGGTRMDLDTGLSGCAL